MDSFLEPSYTYQEYAKAFGFNIPDKPITFADYISTADCSVTMIRLAFLWKSFPDELRKDEE
jgi:hypothetical protein